MVETLGILTATKSVIAGECRRNVSKHILPEREQPTETRKVYKVNNRQNEKTESERRNKRENLQPSKFTQGEARTAYFQVLKPRGFVEIFIPHAKQSAQSVKQRSQNKSPDVKLSSLMPGVWCVQLTLSPPAYL